MDVRHVEPQAKYFVIVTLSGDLSASPKAIMEHITNAGNVEVPAYLALQQLGFSLERRMLTNDSEFWVATKNGLSFSGNSTIEVLGLCLMRSTRGAEWKATDEEINRYLRTYYPDALKGSNDPE